jgi:GTP-binding protein HflX
LQTLKEIKADHIPVLTAINKIDRLDDPAAARLALDTFPNAAAISALTGEGVADLLAGAQEQLFERYIPLDVHLPYKEGKLISLFHDQGRVELVEHRDGGVHLVGNIPGRYIARFSAYLRQQEDQENLE